MSDAVMILSMTAIVRERLRQIESEGFSFDHDDRHARGELAGAASAYAMSAAASIGCGRSPVLDTPPPFFQFETEWWKPRSPREDLIRAAALILAEIERLDRAEARANLNQQGH